MKRFLIAVVTLLLTLSCQKEHLSKGLYFADTPDGIIYLELQGGNDCVMFFQGEKQADGYYRISDGEIMLMASVTKGTGGEFVSWSFASSLGMGIISDDSFSIQAQRTSITPGLDYRYVTFYKH